MRVRACVCTCGSAVKPQEDGGVSDQLYAEIKPAVDGANYIIKHMHNKNNYNEVGRLRVGVGWAWPARGRGHGAPTLIVAVENHRTLSLCRRKTTGAGLLAPSTGCVSSW